MHFLWKFELEVLCRILSIRLKKWKSNVFIVGLEDFKECISRNTYNSYAYISEYKNFALVFKKYIETINQKLTNNFYIRHTLYHHIGMCRYII